MRWLCLVGENSRRTTNWRKHRQHFLARLLKLRSIVFCLLLTFSIRSVLTWANGNLSMFYVPLNGNCVQNLQNEKRAEKLSAVIMRVVIKLINKYMAMEKLQKTIRSNTKLNERTNNGKRNSSKVPNEYAGRNEKKKPSTTIRTQANGNTQQLQHQHHQQQQQQQKQKIELWNSHVVNFCNMTGKCSIWTGYVLLYAIVQNGPVLCGMPGSNWKKGRRASERQLCCHFSMFDGFLYVLFSTAVMTKPMIMGNDGGDCIAGGDAFILVSFGVCVRFEYGHANRPTLVLYPSLHCSTILFHSLPHTHTILCMSTFT